MIDGVSFVSSKPFYSCFYSRTWPFPDLSKNYIRIQDSKQRKLTKWDEHTFQERQELRRGSCKAHHSFFRSWAVRRVRGIQSSTKSWHRVCTRSWSTLVGTREANDNRYVLNVMGHMHSTVGWKEGDGVFRHHSHQLSSPVLKFRPADTHCHWPRISFSTKQLFWKIEKVSWKQE